MSAGAALGAYAARSTGTPPGEECKKLLQEWGTTRTTCCPCLFAAHDIRMRHLAKVCGGAATGVAILCLCVPVSPFDTTLGPALVAACAWAAGPLSSGPGRARAAASCVAFTAGVRAVMVTLFVGGGGTDWAARAAAAAQASQQLGLGGGGILQTGVSASTPAAAAGLPSRREGAESEQQKEYGATLALRSAGYTGLPASGGLPIGAQLV